EEEAGQERDGGGESGRRDHETSAIRQREGPIAVLRSQPDARESDKEASEEEVRGDSGVHARVGRVVWLGQDVCEGQQRGQPERDANGRGFEVLPQAGALKTQVTYAYRHEGERRVEDWDRERRREPVRGVKTGHCEQDHLVGGRAGKQKQQWEMTPYLPTNR